MAVVVLCMEVIYNLSSDLKARKQFINRMIPVIVTESIYSKHIEAPGHNKCNFFVAFTDM